MSALPRFMFIVGASGSGTTMLSRLLSRPAGAVSLGGNHVTVPESDREARALIDRFNALTTDLWDRHADFATVERAKDELPRVYANLFGLPAMRHFTHAVYKRSAPFMVGDRYRPDLCDVLDLFPAAVIIVVYRDPCASAASSFRRGFAPSLRQCAVIAEEQLTYLNAQLSSLPADRIIALCYERFCRRPDDWVAAMAGLSGISEAALRESAAVEAISPDRNDRWRDELDAGDVTMLERFFDERRRRQWPTLENTR